MEGALAGLGLAHRNYFGKEESRRDLSERWVNGWRELHSELLRVHWIRITNHVRHPGC